AARRSGAVGRGLTERKAAAKAHAQVSPTRRTARAVAANYPARRIERPIVDDQIMVVVAPGRDVVRRTRLIHEAIHAQTETGDGWKEDVRLKAVPDVLRRGTPL